MVVVVVEGGEEAAVRRPETGTMAETEMAEADAFPAADKNAAGVEEARPRSGNLHIPGDRWSAAAARRGLRDVQ